MIPIIPHFANECLENLKIKDHKWPLFEKKFIQNDIINYVIQINGKKRGLISLKNYTSQEELIKIVKNDKILNKHIDNKQF